MMSQKEHESAMTGPLEAIVPLMAGLTYFNPTTRRLHASTSTAKYRKPPDVGMYVMSATQRWSGPSTLKSRSMRFVRAVRICHASSCATSCDGWHLAGRPAASGDAHACG